MTHRFDIRIFYEDTDMAGIVYYANYLRYIERARSDIVEELGLDQRRMREEGSVFAVTRVEADFIQPARFGDRLVVETTHAPEGLVRWVFDQAVSRAGEVIFRARVTAICMCAEGKPRRLPDILRRRET